MRANIATLIVASLITILAVSSADATPTQVNVRIEGKTETLFEGPIWSEGHDVQASSDTKERSCDGINSLDPQNKTPGPTPTAASVDAMSMIGETFDGQWYPGYNDYFITRWGPDTEEEGMSWGVLVNNVFTSVGGCQYELSAGDEALWAYNAFGGRPFLALFAVSDNYSSGTRPLTAIAELGKPFEVEVLDYSDEREDIPPASPERRGSTPFEGAYVSPVNTSAKGFEKVQIESPLTVITNAQGKATLVFQAPGWHRLKAIALGGEGKESAIRSNRLDVCVPKDGESGCGEPPGEDRVRTPPSLEAEIKAEEVEHKQEEEENKHRQEVKPLPVPEGKSEAPSVLQSESKSEVPAFKVALAGGPAVSEVPVAKVGTVSAPYDDRWSALHYRGHWRRLTQSGAWLGTVSRGGAGAQVSVRLNAGHPVFLLRGTSHAARVEVRAGSHRQVFELAAGAVGVLRQITGARRAYAGTVSLLVLNGTVDLDGVALER